MRLFILIISLDLMFASCIPPDNCPPPRTTYKVVQQNLRDYFPYKKGQKIKFTRYVDTTIIGEVIFISDTPLITHDKSQEWHDCGAYGMYGLFEDVEQFTLKLYNQTEQGMDCKIGITGNYAKNLYANDWDLSDLNLTFRNKLFMFSEFGIAVVFGDKYYATDNIVLNGKNYGNGFCIQSYLGTRIYFNSVYGILKFINDSTKEQLLYTP